MLLQPHGRERFEQLILAHRDPAFVKQASKCFRGLGWQVFCGGTAAEARRLARRFAPAVIVLDTDLPDETGWLTCAKLLDEHPDLRVFLVSPRRTPVQVRFADFVGASGLLWRHGGLKMLSEEIDGDLLAAC